MTSGAGPIYTETRMQKQTTYGFGVGIHKPVTLGYFLCFDNHETPSLYSTYGWETAKWAAQQQGN